MLEWILFRSFYVQQYTPLDELVDDEIQHLMFSIRVLH